MRNIAYHDHRKQRERMKFLRIIFGCPAGAREWRILFFAMIFIVKIPGALAGVWKNEGTTERLRHLSGGVGNNRMSDTWFFNRVSLFYP